MTFQAMPTSTILYQILKLLADYLLSSKKIRQGKIDSHLSVPSMNKQNKKSDQTSHAYFLLATLCLHTRNIYN